MQMKMLMDLSETARGAGALTKGCIHITFLAGQITRGSLVSMNSYP